MAFDSRRIVLEFDFPDCGDEQLSGPKGLMTKALELMLKKSRADAPMARGEIKLRQGSILVRWVHSYFDWKNL